MKNVLVLYNSVSENISRISIEEIQFTLKHKDNVRISALGVLSVFEIPHALNIAFDTQEYDGVVVLVFKEMGCDDSYEKMVTENALRNISDIATHYVIPIALSFIKYKSADYYDNNNSDKSESFENSEDKEKREEGAGVKSNILIAQLKEEVSFAAKKCIQLMNIKKRLNSCKSEYITDFDSHSDKTH